MIPPDHEIHEVEARIAQRRHDVAQTTQAVGRRTFVALTSPGALAGAAVVGFLAGGGLGRRRPKVVDRRKSAQAAAKTGIAGVLMSGAMWLVRARFGSPVGLARYLLEKMPSRRPAATAPMASRRG